MYFFYLFAIITHIGDVMKNRLGLNDEKLLSVEREIVNLKINLLDEYFTFNMDIFSLNYLKELHKFLFLDIYYDYQTEMVGFPTVDEKYIKYLLEGLRDTCINYPNRIENILNPIKELWKLQPFYDGNTRTFIAYLKVLKHAFDLSIDIDLDNEIVSMPKTFTKENFVNQKRLTK